MDTDKKRLIVFINILIISSFLILLYLSWTGNTNQIFTDVVNELTAIHGSNKGAERKLFFCFSIIGGLLYSLFYLKYGSTQKNDTAYKYTPAIYVIVALLVSMGINYIVYTNVNCIVIVAIILAILLYVKDKSLVVHGVSFLFISIYAISALYRLWIYSGYGDSPLSVICIAVVAFILSSLIMNGYNAKSLYTKGILLMQVTIPFLMLVYLASTYKYGEEYIKIHIPYRIQVLVWGIIIIFIIEAVKKVFKQWNKASHMSDILGYGTCVAIMSFNRYSGSGSIIWSDLHHPYENIIGYTQIVEWGQKLFSEYIPVSGMYSLVHGWFMSFLGHGEVSYYYLTTNLFYLFTIFIVVFLLRRQLQAEWVLLITLIYLIIDYDRIAFILPIMLLLAWSKLIEKRSLWLKVWFLTSFLHGLYYPVFGAAVCIAFLPMGIWQIYVYAKYGDLRKDIKTTRFWIGWLLCFIPVICGGKLLIGTVKHMMAMGEQTVYADGITRFGQIVPAGFCSYIQTLPIRLIIYYLCSFLIVISLVWLSIALFYKNGEVYIKDKKLKMDNPVGGCLSLSFGLMLLVAFSYTVIRMDIGSIYARNDGIVRISFVIIVILVANYMKDNKNAIWVFAFAMFSIAIVSSEGFFSIGKSAKLEPYYTVPEGYVYVTEDSIERLGECFVAGSVYDELQNVNNVVSSLDREKTYLGVVGQFGLFYLFDIKGDSVMEITRTIKGYDATKETVELIRNNETLVGDKLSVVNNYYLYHWLITSGEYIWDSENRLFIPNDGSASKEEILEQNKNMELGAEDEKLGRVAGSWGSSMDTLEEIFSEENADYDINKESFYTIIDFNQMVNGEDADFIYVEFANMDKNYEYILFNLSESIVQETDRYNWASNMMKKDYNRGMAVTVYWTDEIGIEHNMNCAMDEGKLLIPIGAGKGWLLNEHSEIRIVVKQGENIIETPEITSFRLLKLREIE